MKVSKLHTLLKFDTRMDLYYSNESHHDNQILVTSLDTSNAMTGIVCKDDAKEYANKFISKYGDIEFIDGLWKNSYKPLKTPIEIQERNQINAEAISHYYETKSNHKQF